MHGFSSCKSIVYLILNLGVSLLTLLCVYKTSMGISKLLVVILLTTLLLWNICATFVVEDCLTAIKG